MSASAPGAELAPDPEGLPALSQAGERTPAAAVPSRLRSRTLALAVGLALVAAAQAEIGLRLRAWYDDLRLDRSVHRLEARKPPPEGKKVALTEMIQLSANPRIIYELIPRLSVNYVRPVHTNGAGFRSPEIPVAKPPKTVRLVGLGDSIMFGFGVGDDESFMPALAQRLKARQPELDWQSINTAVPGYNTVMEVETLEKKCLAYDPDVVIVNFVGGDDDLPNFIRRRSEPLALDKSFLGEFLRALRSGKPARDDFALADAPRADVGFEGDPEKVPPEYRDMVGWPAYERAMTRLRDLSDEHGFRVVVLGHPAVYTQVRELARSLGFPVVESLRFMHRYMREHGIESERDLRLILAPHDSHPTALLHGVIADALVDGLDRSGVLAEVTQIHDPSRRGLDRLRLEFWTRLRAAFARVRPGYVRFRVGWDPTIRVTADDARVNLELTVDRHAHEARVRVVSPVVASAGGAADAPAEPCETIRQQVETATGAPAEVRPESTDPGRGIVSVTRSFDLVDRASWDSTQEWMARTAVTVATLAPRAARCTSPEGSAADVAAP
ncbi:MAG: SGNH/GDSL hydrolase family protein [bacterium]